MSFDLKPKILIVDDQPQNLLALDAMLEGVDCEVIRAESGRAALRKLLETDVAVILLDVQMPEMDGFETATLIRQRDRSRDTPIIFVTALSRNEENVFRGYSIGAVDYLFKPIDPEILRSKISVFVELFRQNNAIKQQAAELRRLSRQNQLILDSAAEGICGVDLEGNCTFANRAAADMLGTRIQHLVANDIHALVHSGAGEKQNQRCSLQTAFSTGASAQAHEDTFYRVDGNTLPVDYLINPIRDNEGQVIGSVFTFRDVTERRAAAQAKENERRYREAEAANRAKDEFLATLSHELRTPMTAILGWLQMLRMDDIDDATFDEGLDTIEGNAKLQAHLIEDMLDVSRIIVGKFRIDLQPTDVSAVITSAVETVRHAAEQKGVNLVTDFKDGSKSVMGDANRLQQVVWNLLSNAIKFTDSGEVKVVLNGDEKHVRIEVTDSGRGISPEFLPHVFERLKQADTSGFHGGLGLGLSIAQHIVQLHGGEIHAQSRGVGKGATFTVTLPAREGGDPHPMHAPDGRLLPMGQNTPN